MIRKTEARRLCVALVESDEKRIERFFDAAKMQCPQLAIVDGAKSEDYADES